MSGLDYRAHAHTKFSKKGEKIWRCFYQNIVMNFWFLVRLVFTQHVWISVIILSDSCRLSLSLGCMKAKLLPHAVPVGQSLDFCVEDKILITCPLRGLPQKKLKYSVAERELFIQQSANHAGWMALLLQSVHYCGYPGEDKGNWSASNVRSNFKASGGKFRWIPNVRLPTVSAAQCWVEWSSAI